MDNSKLLEISLSTLKCFLIQYALLHKLTGMSSSSKTIYFMQGKLSPNCVRLLQPCSCSMWNGMLLLKQVNCLVRLPVAFQSGDWIYPEIQLLHGLQGAGGPFTTAHAPWRGRPHPTPALAYRGSHMPNVNPATVDYSKSPWWGRWWRDDEVRKAGTESTESATESAQEGERTNGCHAHTPN
jgi:hypothetical protein